MAPGVSSCIRLSERRKVVLPQPEEPISAVTLFGAIVIVDPLDGLEVAVVEVTSRASIVVAGRPVAPARGNRGGRRHGGRRRSALHSALTSVSARLALVAPNMALSFLSSTGQRISVL